jgi:ubiquinone/menaquinone biosynthesis C-methylase UbiE
MSVVQAFFKWNKDICQRIERTLPNSFSRHLHTSYKHIVARRIDALPGQVIVDVGGGKTCPYLAFSETRRDQTIIATDIAETELRQNKDLSLKVVADASRRALPFKTSSVNLITSRSVMEHLPDNAAFLESCRDVLVTDGLIIHTFPCKYSPFSILNRILPNSVTRLLLSIFHRNWVDECGFVAHYDHCSYNAMKKILESKGYVIIHLELRYYQAIYYDFFIPLYLIMLAYDLLIWAVDARALCGQMLVVARKVG